MGSGLVDVLGPAAVLLIVGLWLAIIATAVITPFVLLSVATSLRGIQRELRRMNGTPEVSRGGLFPEATVRTPEPQVASLGHQLLR